MISFKEVLEFMQSGKVFSCRVVSFNKKEQTGGEVKTYRAVLLQGKQQDKLRGLTAKEKEAQSDKLEKNPNHRSHYTRNIRLVTDDGFKTDIINKIHIPLIVEFNGQKVTP